MNLNVGLFVSSLLFCALLAGVSATWVNERLDVTAVSNQPGGEKAMLHFSFESDLNHEATAWSEFRDNLLESNVEDLKFEIGFGRINPLLTEGYEFSFPIPSQGSQLWINPEADWPSAVHFLSSSFGFTAANLIKHNVFHSRIGAKSYNYGNSPTEVFCVENLIRILPLLPCRGEKGVSSLLDDSKASRSDHISLTLSFTPSRLRIEVNMLVDSLRLGRFIRRESVQSCPSVSSSTIVLHDKRNPTILDLISSGKIEAEEIRVPRNVTKADSSILSQSPVIATRLLHDKPFSFFAKLETRVENRSPKSSQIVAVEYIPYYLLPDFAHISVFVDGNATSNYTLDIEYKEKSFYLLTFTATLGPNKTMSILTPIEKLLQTFENYSHDPFRGFDLISHPLAYQIEGDSKVHLFRFENNLMTIVPQPDLSMPFNIMTVTMGIFGYLFLSIFSLFVKRTKSII